MKYVINSCYGGFGISGDAARRLVELGYQGVTINDLDLGDLKNSYSLGTRSNPLLVQVVEELGGAASGLFADLKIVEAPDDVEVEIEEHDGYEQLRTKCEYFG